MKTAPLTASTLILLIASAVLAQTEPSLRETTDWLTSTFATHGKCIEQTAKSTDSERVENLQFDNCSLSATYIFESAIDSRILFSAIHDATMRLSDIERVEVTKKNRHWMVTAYTKGKTVKGELRIGIPGHYSRQPLAASEIALPCDDEEVAGRIRKAMLHAVETCKKQKEPF